MTRPLMLHFGAGNIGRSLVGTVFSKAGYDILFVDALPAVVDALHSRHGYRVVIKDNLPPGAPDHVEVTNVDGLLTTDTEAIAEAVSRADLIGTSVGARFLPDVLKKIAPGLLRRDKPVSIVFCENLHGVTDLARETLQAELPAGFDLKGRVGLIATSIGKMVPIMPAEVRARDPLEVWGEAYNVIVADGQSFVGFRPEVEGLELRDNFGAYVDRKLYIHNLGHATCACLGSLRGCTYIWEAMAVPDIAATTHAAMMESARALIKLYPQEFNEENQTAHVDDLLRRFRNKALGDTVFRVGRDLKRKLADGDRFIGSLKIIRSTGGDITPVCRGLAAALQFKAVDQQGKPFPSDVEVLQRVAEIGPTAFLCEHAKLDPNQYADALFLIARFYHELKTSALS